AASAESETQRREARCAGYVSGEHAEGEPIVKMKALLSGVLVAAAWSALATGCGNGDEGTGTGGGDDHGHAHDDGHDHDHDHGDGQGHGGELLALGEASVGGFTVVVTRDEGQIEAGGDAPVDVTVAPADTAAG